jgi:hypothetical protein
MSLVAKDDGWLRWEKRADTYLAMLHLACGLVTSRAAGLFAREERLSK